MKDPLEDPKPVIQLWHLSESFLIIPGPSGVIYSNQAAGVACRHPQLEGAAVLFGKDLDMSEAASSSIVPHVGCWADGLSEKDADELDAFFRATSSPVIVDRARLCDSTEAWVWVTVAPPLSNRETDLRYLGSYSGPAVFTWENCD